MTPSERYQADLQKPDFFPDPAQQIAVAELQRLYDALITEPDKKTGLFGTLFSSFKNTHKEPVTGIYFWGGVGRGKTYLMDTFFECLPFSEKKRVHFHRYMQSVHHELKPIRDRQNPLTIIADEFAAKYRILCFDEFFVSDIADAMILAGLLGALFERGVSLVATSNTRPEELYKDGLQRDSFLPAIELIKKHTKVINLDGGVDYRLRFFDSGGIYHHPLSNEAEEKMMQRFMGLAPENFEAGAELDILGRIIFSRYLADGVAWFEFIDLCDGPRSQSDYIELARFYHTVLLSNIPVMDNNQNDPARRFIELVDEFYDRNVNLIVSAAAPPDGLYTGELLKTPFQRTASRLHEMQSNEYLSRQHKA